LARENEGFTRKENIELIYASFGYKGTIKNLNDELSKLMQQNKELISQLEENSKTYGNNEKNYKSQIEVLKRELIVALEKVEKLAKNEKNFKFEIKKLSENHNKEKNKLEYFLSLVRSMLSYLCKKNRDLIQNESIKQNALNTLSLQVESLNK